jgi:diguanylate cyclase (GGDEF)-like protein
MNQDQVFGVIELFNGKEDGVFTEVDEQILITIADFAGIAIANAKAMARIKELAITDDLTGLYNSRYLFEQVEYEVERSKRYNTPLSLVFFDLDRFKNVNDSYGHLAGSRLLAEVGGIVSTNIRKSDKAARYGGDEFVVILPQTEKCGAVFFARKLLEAFQKYRFVAGNGDRLPITASFGVASFPDDADTANELINIADESMYLVKQSGRNGVLAAVSPAVKDIA